MPNLFGKSYTPEQLTRLVGDMGQIAGVRLAELSDGVERGIRTAELYTGSGLRFTVQLDRGMDVGSASYKGRPLAWRSAAGFGNPARFEPAGLGWLRTFGGGLMTGCGMTYMGAPCTDQGEALGLHGRLSHIPAMHVSSGGAWEGDDYIIWVSGQVRDAVIFGDKLQLTRRISTRLGSTSFHIHDRVENIGGEPAPHMMLYHCNFGFPVVSPDTELRVNSTVEPRDEVAAPGLDQHAQFEAPTPGYAEQVFFHTVTPDEAGYAQAALYNRALGFGGYVRYRYAELPHLTQWKMVGVGDYVCGLEPGNAWVTGRAAMREAGLLKQLEPGEVVEYHVEIGVIEEKAV